MGNVKVRKTRHVRQGISANPFPTTEQIVTGVATGVLTNLAQRAIAKAQARLKAASLNSKAGATVRAVVDGVASAIGVPPQPTTLTPQEAVKQRKSRKKKKKVPAAAVPAPRAVRK